MKVLLTLFFVFVLISCNQSDISEDYQDDVTTFNDDSDFESVPETLDSSLDMDLADCEENDLIQDEISESDNFEEAIEADDYCDDNENLDIDFCEEDYDNGTDNDIDEDNEDVDVDVDEVTDDDIYVFPCPDGTGGKNCDLCVRYVSPDNTLNKNGLSWSSAFTSIQNAVNSAAEAISSGKEKCSVYIEEGTYSISSSIFLLDNISITGGFFNGNVDSDSCDPQNHATILDGEGSTPHILVPASDLTVENLTIKNGNAVSSADENGGGILIFSTENLFIKNCGFISNTGKNGGAIAITDFSDVEILDCKFLNNTATENGGAIDLNDTGTVLADRNSYSGNSAKSGGAVSFENVDSENVYIYNSLFTANHCDLSGSVFHMTDSFPMLAFNTVAKNGTNTSETLSSNGSSDPILAGNIIFFNNGESISGNITAYYNNIEMLTGVFSGTGNLNSDPKFTKSSIDDFHLLSNSPCIDSVPLELDFIKNDLEGISRPQNGSFDMGCFEYM